MITRKKDGSIKLALNSKLLINQIFKNKYQMPNKHKLIDNIALQLSSKESGEVWFNNLDLKNAYSKLQLCTDTSKQCNFSIVGDETTEIYRFLPGFYGLGDMPNELQKVMNSLLKVIPFTNCYIDDILIASKGSLNEHKAILSNFLNILDNKNMSVKWEKSAFSKKNRVAGLQDTKFGRETIFRFDKMPSKPQKLIRIKVILRVNQPIYEIRSELVNSKFPLMTTSCKKKKSVYQWNDEHTKAFEELK